MHCAYILRPTVRVFGLSTTAGISFREFLIPFVSALTPVAVDCCQTIDPPWPLMKFLACCTCISFYYLRTYCINVFLLFVQLRCNAINALESDCEFLCTMQFHEYKYTVSVKNIRIVINFNFVNDILTNKNALYAKKCRIIFIKKKDELHVSFAKVLTNISKMTNIYA